MIIHLNESIARAKRLRGQEGAERADLEDRSQESRESLVRYQILLAQLKETLARG